MVVTHVLHLGFPMHSCGTRDYNTGMEILLAILIGWIGGAAVNYIADELPSKRRLTKPYCVYCFDPQPLLNYFFWPRYCSSCQHRRPWRVWVVEIAFILISVWLWHAPHDRLGYLLSFVLFVYFGAVVVIDLEHRLILRPLSIGGIILAAACGWLMHGWQNTLIGSMFGFAIMFIFYLFGRLVTRHIARQQNQDPAHAEEAFGSGDVTLAIILGLFLGWPLIWFGLLLGVLLLGVGVLPLAIHLFVKRRMKKEVTQMYIPIAPPFILSTQSSF